MCGIVGYLGRRDARLILVDGLRQLEYRGYDSAGICLFDGKKIRTIKAQGCVSKLEEEIHKKGATISATCGIAHTRWATHGKPNRKNAHPHGDCSGKIWVVHNGIIENYQELKKVLIKRGHKFVSETDTEVLPHLIEDQQKNKSCSLEEAVRFALKKVKGTYGLAIVSSDNPNKIVVAKNGSPLLIGVGDNEHIISSDVSAVVAYTKKVVYLKDGEIAVVTPKGFHVTTLTNIPVKKKEDEIDWDIDQARKGEFEHFMIKEIFDQPEAVANSFRGRLIFEEGLVKLGGLEAVEKKLKEIKRVIISACGTAYHAGCIAEYMIEEYAGIPVEVEYASEFRYRKPVIKKDTAFLVISQSGETADTLQAMREAKRKGALPLGVVNTVGSTIARETEAGVYNHTGPEISVAATKTFTAQVSIMTLITLLLGRQREMSLVTGKRIMKELKLIPKKIERILKDAEKIKKIAEKYSKYSNFLFIGRKYNFPIALEGALKLKEISYIHAEGCGAGEMKHGTIAMIDKNFPTFAICPKDSVYEKMISNIEEIKSRGGPVVAITTARNKSLEKLCDDVIYVPKTLEMLTPLLTVIPLQLWAYYIGVMKGNDVDKPRNLAKSVTVE